MDLAPCFGLEPEQGWSPRVGSSTGHPANSAPRLGPQGTAVPLPPTATKRPVAQFWGLIQLNLEQGVEGGVRTSFWPPLPQHPLVPTVDGACGCHTGMPGTFPA